MVTHMALYRILEYEGTSGRSPFNDWFGGLDAQAAAKINVALIRLAQGNASNIKGIGGGVLEVRLDLVRDTESTSEGAGTT